MKCEHRRAAVPGRGVPVSSQAGPWIPERFATPSRVVAEFSSSEQWGNTWPAAVAARTGAHARTKEVLVGLHTPAGVC